MKRKLIILGVILFTLAAYSGWWFYQSRLLKRMTVQVLHDISTDLHGANTEFLYSVISVSGFPFRYDIYIHQPHFTGDGDAYPYDVVSQGPIVFGTNLLGTTFSLKLPREIEVTYNSMETTRPYQLLFGNKPQLEVSLHYPHPLRRLRDWLLRKKDVEAFLLNDVSLKAINLKADRVSLFDTTAGSQIFALKDLNLLGEVTHTGLSDYTLHTVVNMDSLQAHHLLNSADLVDPFSYLTVNMDSTATLPWDWENENDVASSANALSAHLKQCDIVSNLFELHAKGDLDIAPGNVKPELSASLNINHYHRLLNYYGVVLNKTFKHFGYANLQISQNRLKQLPSRLEKLASKLSNDKKDISFAFHREPETKGVFVGQYHLEDALAFLDKGIMPKTNHQNAIAHSDTQNDIDKSENSSESTESLEHDIDAESDGQDDEGGAAQLSDTQPAAGENSPATNQPNTATKTQQKKPAPDTVYEYPNSSGRR